MRIFLLGFMGSGKSTLGKQLAKKLEYDYADQDEWIEKKTGMTVSEYFARMGEDSFRLMENKALKELVLIDNIVISTGGGAPCFHDNITFMNKHGVTIYLKLKPEVLQSRLRYSHDSRPLIRGKTDSELLEYIHTKLSEREPYYLKAKHVIESLDLKSDDLVQLLRYTQ
jgi:shikimate kinase